uniref:Uncharacterized protein n=1 Tax=Ditylenchus dipsaci TaxID=166011 RepID=A0A915EE04_9BILA
MFYRLFMITMMIITRGRKTGMGFNAEFNTGGEIWFSKVIDQFNEKSYQGDASKCLYDDRHLDGGWNETFLFGYGYTLHYCDRNGTLQRIFLGLSEIRGSHTGSLIRRETQKMLSDYGLSVDKLFNMVIDGASNMEKAFKDVFEVDGLQFLDEDEDCEFVDGIDDENTTENIPEVDVIICSAFPSRVKCLAHSLQLAFVDELRMSVLPSSAYLKMMDVENSSSPAIADKLEEIMDKRFEFFMNPDSLDFDPLFLMDAVFDPNTAWQLFEEDFNIRFEQPEVMEEPASVVCLDATLDRLMEESARKQASQRKQKEPNRGKSWVVQILKRVIGMNPFGKEKIDSLKYWTSQIDTEGLWSGFSRKPDWPPLVIATEPSWICSILSWTSTAIGMFSFLIML